MHILVVGVTGFIGSALANRLIRDGATVSGVSRSSPSVPAVRHVSLDIGAATAPEDWAPLLKGIDAVVYCAGALQGSSLQVVHDSGPRALFRACAEAGVNRVVHLSALGVDRAATAFSGTKLRGDEALMASELDWVILRPCVVIGHNAFGGAALLRGLAALPVLPLPRDAGPLQVVQLDDVVETIAILVRLDAPARVALELVGPRAWEFKDLIGAFRRWLGWPPAYTVDVPRWAAALAFGFGDVMGWLGWRTALTSTAGRELIGAPTGDARRWRELTGIEPRGLEQSLLAEPAPVQERWFAALYLLRPLLFAVCALFWAATGVIALGPGWKQGMGLMNEGGMFGLQAAAIVVGGALCDIAVGLAIAWRRTARAGVIAALVVTVLYAVIGTALVPRLWADPMGAMLKVLPILALHFVLLAILDER